MKEIQKGHRNLVIYGVMFAVSMAFYFAWYLADGIILTEDAMSYINMQSDREPGYCLYLYLFRMLLGTDISLHGAVIGQCVIAAIAACAITKNLTELFSLNWFGSAGILAIQYGITLLNRFVAQRKYSYFNSIESEGLAYSLWVFYFLNILGIVYKKDKKSLIGAVLWSVALISIRKHMMITLFLLFCVIIFCYMKEKNWRKIGIYVMLGCVLSFAGTKLIECCYNWIFRGEFALHTGDSSFILGTELYLADKEMVENISDAESKEIFLEILKRADEKGYNYAYADKGWQAKEEHYFNSYDRIKFDIVMSVIREHQEMAGIVEADREADYNRIAGTMMKELLVPSVPRIINLFFCNMIYGFITTILKVHRLLNWIALFLYLLYIGTIIGVFVWRGRQAENVSNNSGYFALLVLLSIVVNVCFTSLTIYCQMRYMLYNTGLYYQAWWVMIMGLYEDIKNNKRITC